MGRDDPEAAWHIDEGVSPRRSVRSPNRKKVGTAAVYTGGGASPKLPSTSRHSPKRTTSLRIKGWRSYLHLYNILLGLVLVITIIWCFCPGFPEPDAAVRGNTRMEVWKEKDPQICVLVSTYARHGLKLTALALSLLSSAYPYIDLILLDTDSKLDSHLWMVESARVLNSMVEGRPRVHLSARTQQQTETAYPKMVTPDYGYLLSDLVLKDLQELAVPGVPKCDYIMVTNGDNLYSSNLIDAVLPHMRDEKTMIGFWFVSHYDAERFGGIDRVVHTEFKRGMIDKGSFLFHFEYVTEKKLHFYMQTGQDNPKNVKRAPNKKIMTEVMDGLFINELKSMPDTTSVIVERVLQMHL